VRSPIFLLLIVQRFPSPERATPGCKPVNNIGESGGAGFNPNRGFGVILRGLCAIMRWRPRSAFGAYHRAHTHVILDVSNPGALTDPGEPATPNFYIEILKLLL
jgi:hypothetical protein